MNDITFDEVKVEDRIKLLYPLERGDGIEFPEGAEFPVTLVTKHHIRLHCKVEGSHWQALVVAIPKDQPCNAIGNLDHYLK